MRRDAHCVINLYGPRGSGKTAALRHLAAAFPDDGSVTLIDEAGACWPAGGTRVARPGERVLIAATRRPIADPQAVGLEMAPWGPDDAIEYLLATRRPQCASVMDRLKGSGGAELWGLAELWTVVLDQMAADGSLATPADALRHYLAGRLGDAHLRELATGFCLQRLLRDADEGFVTRDPPGYFERADAVVARLIAYRPVQVILAAQRIVWDLAAGHGRDYLATRFPEDLVDDVAALAAYRPPVMEALCTFLRGGDRPTHPTAATLLHATKTGWRPEAGSRPTLTAAVLAGASWPGIDLSHTCISAADLSGARLSCADLDGAAAGSTVLRGASLRGAWLRGIRAANADLSAADLCGAHGDRADFAGATAKGADLSAASCRAASFGAADLEGARMVATDLRKARLDGAKLSGANLTGADLRRASLKRVDLSRAELSGARFGGAKLRDCDLQGVELPSARFRRADFTGADLTGSVMPRADFRRAVLRGAGLADVEWKAADLRGADFTGASFHLGSSRSGLVGSVVPCEGSRTGFYTDDYDEQSYRPPEEVRKADLRGADLRGAKVEGADFYLVDLRGARYTRSQEAHFRTCGAIL
jgi:uncharacterized protein YjbI with pentapeptide repeats